MSAKRPSPRRPSRRLSSDAAARPKRRDHDSREPVVEEFAISRQIQRWLTETDGHLLAPDSLQFSPEDQHEFRPRLRPAVPVLTALDDGSSDIGDDFRLRHEVTTIGRSEGTIQIKHDASLSHLHAEVTRTAVAGGHRWHLRDLGSTNGTFVRCRSALLHDHAIAIVGSKRLRLRNPLRSADAREAAPPTHVLDLSLVPAAIWPVLEETAERADRLAFPLKHAVATIGRRGGGADIELDDPLLANHHATLKRLQDGTWALLSENTRNGVWVSATSVALTRHCFFRCGEQQFRFLIP